MRQQEKEFARSKRENDKRKRKEETLILEQHLKVCECMISVDYRSSINLL